MKPPRFAHPRRRSWLPPAALLSLSALVSASYPRSQSSASGAIWRENRFADFADGTFGDGGANTYVSARGRIQLVNRWDLNQDGFIDLVFANTHPHVEKLDAAIYWGNGKDFDGARISFVPNDGAQHATVADLDRDGRLDAVLANYTNGTWDGMDSFVYFGGLEELKARQGASQWGFHPFARKLSLPTRAAQQSAVADLNKDGFPDIVFALSAGFWEYRASGKEGGYESASRIFWGSARGFTPENRTDLPALGAASVAVADLNGDSWPDVVFANHERQGNPDVDSYVYWGGPKGFDPSRRTGLPTRFANWVTVADLNGDKLPDLVFANGKGPVSYVYWNDRRGFAADRRLELPTSDARGCAAADLNRDGWNDLFFTNHQTAGNPLTFSYLYWGGPEGLSPKRRQDFETVGAWGVSLGDLNRDGFPEIVVSNYKEHFSFDVPSYVYWSARGAFSDTRRTSLFTHGAVGNVVADFDGDGRTDVMFMNTVARSRGGISPIYVYWGDARGRYDPRRRLSLPAVDPYEWAAADLNDDGWNDLVVANFGETVRWRQESYVYWGGPKGLSAERRSALMGNGSAGVSTADLDRDGYLDVVLSNAPKAEDPDKGAFIYWGGPDGFVTTERTELPAPAPGPTTLADLNYDGHLDIVMAASGKTGVPILWGDGTRNYSTSRMTFVPGSDGASGAEVADLNRDSYLDLIVNRAVYRGARRTDSYVYWGNARGEYSAERRTRFETEGTIVITVADVNQDGWLDLVCPNYNTDSSRATLSRVYLGGPDGITAERMFKLPTNAGAGSMVADFNQDGYPDILMICHRSEGDPNRIGSFGDHMTDSYLYWGGPGGFSPDNRLAIPARGPHNDSGVDLGNVYDRRLEFDYVSSAHEYGRRVPRSLSWRAETPYGSAVRFQVRTAATRDELRSAPWTGPAGPETFFDRPGDLPRSDPGHSWIQYRAVLRSPTGAASPILDEVMMMFR